MMTKSALSASAELLSKSHQLLEVVATIDMKDFNMQLYGEMGGFYQKAMSIYSILVKAKSEKQPMFSELVGYSDNLHQLSAEISNNISRMKTSFVTT